MLITVSESSQTGDARRRAVAFSEDMRFSENRRSEIALVATEMATNLVKHAGSGYVLLQALPSNGHSGLRIISVDKGPGIRDLSKAFTDGHSTAGTMGNGLGVIRRTADRFQIYSSQDSGTVLVADFWNDVPHENKMHAATSTSMLEVGVVSEPIAGEVACGDGWATRVMHDGFLVMVVDGLGHGELAAAAAREAERILRETKEESLPGITRHTHDALRKTRGAAFGLARVEVSKGLLSFVGVGNISTSIVTPGQSRSVASHNGILGQNMQRVQEFTAPWNDNSMLIMHSDGMATRWDIDRYPGIWGKHPAVAAALLHRDYTRGRDDVTVLTVKASNPD